MPDFVAARKPARSAARDEEATDAVSPITRELSAYVGTALRHALPAEVAEKTRHHLLDTLAAMVSGARLPPGRKAIAWVRAQGGRRQATRRRQPNRQQRAKRGARQRHVRACRRDRRFPRRRALPPRLRGGAGGAGLRRAGRARRREPAARRGAGLRHRRALRHGARARQGLRPPAQHPQPGRPVRRCRGRRRAARPRGAPGALPAVLRGAAGLGPRLLDARSGPHREGVRFRRHAGAQQRGRGDHGRGGLHRGRGAAHRPARLPRGVRRGAATRGAGRGARPPLRDHAGADQALARGRADPGRPRRARAA